jgi:antirestriction protein ArdC
MTYPWAAGEVLTAADLNAYAGLVYIASGAATSGTTLDINNVFSAQYDSYCVVIAHHQTTDATARELLLRMKVGGTVATTGYYFGVTRVDIAAAAINVVAGNNATSLQTSCIANNNGAASAVFDIHNPFLTKYTVFNGQTVDNRNALAYGGITCTGQLANTTSYTDLRLLIGSGTISNLRVKVYGYNNG